MFKRAGARGVLALALVMALFASACGDDSGDAEASGGDSGDTVKVGILHSLSGTMSISEVAVHDAELLAIQEINENGGVLGRQIEPVIEDGASDWPTFAEKAQKLISQDKVAATFGGWTSASRKAMLPVFERNKALLYYPVQYEGMESSPYIFYTGATTNQQILPALEYLKDEKKTKSLYLVGSDYVFPRTANKEIKAWAKANDVEVLGEEYAPLGSTEFEQVLLPLKIYLITVESELHFKKAFICELSEIELSELVALELGSFFIYQSLPDLF